MDQEIELAEPSFIPLSQEEAAEAARLLAALIPVARGRRADSGSTPHRESASTVDLADGSPSAPRYKGKAAPAKGAGGDR